VVTFHLLPLTVLLSLPLPIGTELQTAFLENSQAALCELLASEGTIPVSLPEPLSLADQLSHDQACLVFGRLFSVLKTREFITDPQVISLPGASGGILRARWSFLNERTGAQIALRVYFFVVPVRAPPDDSGRGPWLAFRIVEIRAEKV
jgi:hypothetical protein